MNTSSLLSGLVLLSCLTGCGGGSDEPVEPLGKLDFRPNSEFGIEAVITGLRLGKQVIDERMPEDGVARAEGYRFMLRLIEMNLNTLAGDHDPAHPQINRCPSKNCKLGFDNPDYTYVGALPLSVDYNYRLYGDRGTADLILFQVLERSDLKFRGTSRTDSQRMQVNPDGSWEIFLGAKRPSGVPEANFLRLKEENVNLVIRIAHNDWSTTVEPSINIEMIDPVRKPVEALTPMRMAITGFAFSKMIPGQISRWIDIIEGAPLNAVDQPCPGWASGCQDGGFGNYAAGGRYRLEEDEALIIEATRIPTLYQNIQLANIWGESLDYANKQTSLNGVQAALNDDGVHRYVLAHSDPGVPNWLDISGHPEGAVFMRWVKPEEGAVPPQPAAKVVPLAKLRDHLPTDTAAITPERRATLLKQRLQAYNRRVNPANFNSPGEPSGPRILE